MAKDDVPIYQLPADYEGVITKQMSLQAKEELMKQFFATHSYDRVIDWRAAVFDETEDQ